MNQLQTAEVPDISSPERAELDRLAIANPPLTETDIFLQDARDRLEKAGHFGSFVVEEQVRQRQEGMIVKYPYLKDFFVLSKQGDNPEEHDEIERKRLESLVVGAAAYGERDIAKKSLNILIALGEDTMPVLDSISAQIGLADQLEGFIQMSAKMGLGTMSLNGDPAFKEAVTEQRASSTRRSSELDMARVMVRQARWTQVYTNKA